MRLFRHEILNSRTLGGKFKVFPEEPLNPSELIKYIRNSKEDDYSFLMQHFAPIFFYYRRPSSWDLTYMQIMAKAIRADILKVNVEFVSTSPEVDASAENEGPSRGRVIESANHLGMKEWVRKHLHDRDIARDEVSYLGYEVDVGSLDQRIFVECGDTEPSKIFEFLKHGFDIGILQYDSEDIVWFLSSDDLMKFAADESAKLM